MGEAIFAVPFATSLIVLCIIERTINAILCLVFPSSAWKQQAAQSVLVRQVETIMGFVTVFISAIVQTFLYLLSWWIFMALFFTLFAVIHVSYEEYPETWDAFMGFYNAYLGPWVSEVVIVPLQILDVILRGLIPLWDASIWFLKSVWAQGILPIAWKEADTIYKMATVFLDFARHISQSGLAWMQSFECTGDACLIPESRVMDLLTPMGDVRQFIALGIQLARNFCGIFAAPIDLICFPLLDLNLATWVHEWGNAILQLIFVIPHVTSERCSMAKDNTFKTTMCTPDMDPFFNLVTAGTASLGLALDNWLNVALVIVQSALTNTSPNCQTMVKDFVPPDLWMGSDFFGSNFTSLVGLSEWMFAMTDGYSAVYINSDDSGFRTQLWPYPMDPSLGIAAISYSASSSLDASTIMGGHTASNVMTNDMLGCNCSDTEGGIVILCSILPISGIPSIYSLPNYLLQVLFPDENTPRLIEKCAFVDISVHSNRFPATRFETVNVGLGSDSATLPVGECRTRGTCREADATIYVVPRCGDGLGCNSACFPFCMAVRESGSSNNNLQLMSASRWRSGYALLRQDCTLSTAGISAIGTGLNIRGSSSTVSAPPSSLTEGVAAGIFASGPSSQCTPAQRILSTQDKLGDIPIRAAIRLPGQPLFTTGDVVFTQRDLGEGAFAVVVERLSSDDHNTISLDTLNQDFPALPPLSVQSMEATFDDPGKLLIPAPVTYGKVVAVSSRNYVFYSSPPALQSMEAYLDYCRSILSESDLPKIGILMTSSYAPIRIYRVSAFRRCASYSCGGNLVKYAQIQGFDTKNLVSTCKGVFNVSVVRLEYINEDNIAVVVQHSSTGEYDVKTGKGKGTNSGYSTYWLNPQSMRLSGDLWTTSLPSSGYGTLCPGMQRTPRVGSMVAEVVGSVIAFFKFITGIVIYSPGLSNIWKDGGKCPLPGAALRHSILLNCGDSLLSLEDFFDHLDDASLLFWHSLSIIARISSSSNQLSPITNLLNGMAQYGQGSMDLWTTGRSVLTLTKLPFGEKEEKALEESLDEAGQEGVQQQTSGSNPFNGAFHVSAGPVAWARFIYRVVSDIIMVIIKTTVAGQSMTSDKIWNLITTTLYDLKEYYKVTITERTRMACAGIRLMMGNTNPFSKLAYSYCASGAELQDNLLSVILDIFVQIPMIKCVCKDSMGQNVQNFVTNVCAPQLPVSMRTQLYMIVNQLQGSTSSSFRQLACDKLVKNLRSDLRSRFNPTFTLIKEYGLDALNNIFDYLLIPFDKDSGDCRDFQRDPHMIVLVPQPVDYFMQCAKTSICQKLCANEWAAFNLRNSTPIQLPSLEVETESRFFPGEYDVTLSISNVSAITEVSPTNKCTQRTPPDSCVAVAQLGDGDVSVKYFCIPKMPADPVYKSTNLGYGPTKLPGTAIFASFLDDDGVNLALMIRVGSEDNVYILTPLGLSQAPSYLSLAPPNRVFVRIGSMWAVEGQLFIDALVRGYTGAEVIAEVVNLRYVPNTTRWSKTNVDLSPYGGGNYWFTRVIPFQYLLLPTKHGPGAFLATFSVQSNGIKLDQIIAANDLTTYDFQSNLRGNSIVDRTLSPERLFSAASDGWNWLSEIRISGSKLGVYQSSPVITRVEQTGSCDTTSCEGCQDLITHRLCQAYAKCSLMNCIGTPIQLKRPLCGMGGVLRAHAAAHLVATQGAWEMLAEMLTLVLKISTTRVGGVDIEFPEDSFVSSMCVAKDASASAASVLTSMLNTLIQLGNANVGYMYHGAVNVDTNSDAILTITMSSVTAFISQVFKHLK